MFFNYFIAAILVIWAVASVFAQAKVPHVLKFDFLGILPTCRFFAPRPVSKDFALYAGYCNDPSGQMQWKRIYNFKKKWFVFAWNPYHRLKKSIGDIYNLLEAESITPVAIHLSLPYLLLLSITQSSISANKQGYIQFMLTTYAGYEDSVNEIIFLSNVHRL